MLDALTWVFTQLGMGFYNIVYALSHPASWLDWTDKKALVRFVYYGASKEAFFALAALFLLILLIGLWRREFLWGVVRLVEGFNNMTGRFFAWAALAMVLQQIMIVFLQRIFLRAYIEVSPFGYGVTKDISWWAEELKFYNALIVALCCAYTFAQRGHVRVDLFYAGMSFRAKRVVDMIGSLLFIVPTMSLIWMYGWFFMWRHLLTPKISATDKLTLLERKARILKWNVETIGFSPNGFDGYFLFKILLVTFAGLILISGLAYFYRNLLEFLEGEESQDKYFDKDPLGDELAEVVAEIH